jgi:hypothetical protein
MIYVFEGPRNSGKTYLSQKISENIDDLSRFQFDFVNYFDLLRLTSKDNTEAHSFAMGKELMIMQIARDLNGKNCIGNFIHDRGILTVLAWGLSENRITKAEVIRQIEFIIKNDLLSDIHIIYICGDNPDTQDRNKDQWDYADNNDLEKNAFEFVISKFNEIKPNCIQKFYNNFKPDSLEKLENIIREHIKTN